MGNAIAQAQAQVTQGQATVPHCAIVGVPMIKRRKITVRTGFDKPQPRHTPEQKAKRLLYTHNDDHAQAARTAKQRRDAHTRDTESHACWHQVWKLLTRWQKGTPDGDRRWKKQLSRK